MKRNIMLMFLISVIIASLSGCILSTTPNTAIPITLKVDQSQTFTVSGFLNGAYTWYKNDLIVPGASGTSYVYTALAEDAGENKIKVETREILTNKVLVKEWTVNVVNNLPPIANAGPDIEIQPFTGTDTVQLDGSGSSDPEGQPLTYLWDIASKPEGSNAALSDPYIVNPTFTPDAEGAYSVSLYVSDGEKISAPDIMIVNVFTINVPPTSDAGPDANVLLGNVAQLNGSASFDPEGQSLTYAWTLVNKPNGSHAVLSNPTSAEPTFTPNKKGAYVFSLIVNDGEFNSGVDMVTITVYNNAPVANAGSDIVVDFGNAAQLDGSLSYDPDGTPLTYAWMVTFAPAGSTAAVSDPAIVDPTFTPDKRGVYVLKLVVSDGDLSSEDTVTVSTTKHAPVAEAGSDITIPFGGTVQLNGYLSYDPDEDPLSYSWTIVSTPSGSTAGLSDPTIVDPTFRPDKKGAYVIQLIVFDGEFSSAPDTMTITTTNHKPVAEAGNDIFCYVGSTAYLNGSASSDQDGDPLSFAWTIISNPDSSIATLSGAAIVNPTFIPDKKGDYVIQLIVFDGEEYSLADTVKITAPNRAPTAEAGADISSIHRTTAAQLDGSVSSDPDGDSLTYAWTVTSRPSGSTAEPSNAAIVNPTFTPDKPGTYVIQLIVSDGTASSAADTVTLTTSSTTITENWESGSLGPWTQTKSTGWQSWGTTGVVNDNDNGHGWSYKAQGGYLGGFGNWCMITRPVDAWVTSISFSQKGWATIIGNLNTDLYADGSFVTDLNLSTNNSWVDGRTWDFDRYVTSIGYRFGDFFVTDGAYIDEIVINIWN